MAGKTVLFRGQLNLKQVFYRFGGGIFRWTALQIAVVFLLGLWCAVANAQPSTHSDTAANKRVAQELRRTWVRGQISKLVTNERERTEILARLNDLSDDQIQRVASLCLDELEARRKQQFAALRESNARERAFREQLTRQIPPQPWYFEPQPSFFARPVGFIPLITWLPEGASLSAHAVVSPDGRYVRTSVVPFFSTIGPVYTFNYMTGETRRYDP